MSKIERQLISPGYAEELLRHNNNNRKLNLNYVNKYANDMINGKWKQDTCETIKISSCGNIIDGQHRLHAVVKSGVPVYMHVANGLDFDIMDVVDAGKPRSASDVFMIKGINNSNKLPSIIAFYEMLKDGQTNPQSRKRTSHLSNTKILSIYNEQPLYWQDVSSKVNRWYGQFAKILSPSFIGGVYCYLSEIDKEYSERFFEQLSSGIDVDNNVIHLLRNLLIRDKTSIRRIQSGMKLALVIKSWNHFRNGTTPSILKYAPNNEEFPKPI